VGGVGGGEGRAERWDKRVHEKSEAKKLRTGTYISRSLTASKKPEAKKSEKTKEKYDS
jgi:hypothetical protein